MSVDITSARARYEEHFGGSPEVAVRAPGRVNIIGDHTDYNHGFVLPMAIERETLLLGRARPDMRVNALSANLGQSVSVSLESAVRNSTQGWIDYVVGVAHELGKLGKPVGGLDLLIQGDVPIGCGLSSSASLEMAALTLFETLGGFRIEGSDAPKLGQRVENEHLGLNSGIMDQFVCRMGEAEHAVFLDCRSLDFDLVPVDLPDMALVIANTNVSRGLVDSSIYNQRVAECAKAISSMRELGRAGTHLRDVDLDDLNACRGDLDTDSFRRARHVASENARVRQACEALRAGDAIRLGEMMNGSHRSLRYDYEVSCPELDAMTKIARSLPGCLGSRMTGAGFGGCTINLVQSDKVEPFVHNLLEQYDESVAVQGDAFVTRAAAGSSQVLLV